MLDDTPTGPETPGDQPAGTTGGETPPPAKKAPARRTAAKKATTTTTTTTRSARKAAVKKTAETPSEAPAEAPVSDAPVDDAPVKKAAKKAPAKKTAAKKAPAKKTAAKKSTAKKAASVEPVVEPAAEQAVEPVAAETAAAEAPVVAAPLFQAPEVETATKAPAKRTRTRRVAAPAPEATVTDETDENDETDEAREAAAALADSQTGSDATADDATDSSTDDPADSSAEGDDQAGEGEGGPNRRRRRRGGRRRRKSGGGEGDESQQDDAAQDDAGEASDDARPAGRQGGQGRQQGGKDKQNQQNNQQEQSDKQDKPSKQDQAAGQKNGDDSEDAGESGSSSSRRRRRRRRAGDDGDGGGEGGSGGDDPRNTVTRVRQGRTGDDQIQSVSGSTRLEAKKQRRREGREAGRRRAPIVSEAEFLARRESVERVMAIRQRDDLTQIAVLEDKVLVEHYVARESQTSIIGNVYLGRVQNVLPSMEAAFIDIGKGRNAVIYAGEVNWSALGHKEGQPRKIESVLSSGQSILVQVTKDPIGHKGARLSSQISLAGRFLVYVPDGTNSGISRKLPDTERNRLKSLLKEIVPEGAGVIVRTAAEGASEEELTRDVERLTARWADIEKKSKGSAPQALYGEPDLMLKVVRDLFTEDFAKLVVQGDDAWETVRDYVTHVAPDLEERLERHDPERSDLFATYRIDEQIHKGLDRKVWLPSGGSLVIDRTEAMTVVDVNTGKFTGSGGNLEETVTKNNLEAAEEIVRQLRLRDIGGIIVVDFIDMVLESNRDLVLRRLVECLGRDRTRHQVAEVTSLGLVQMTRKRIGTGLLESFSENCQHCQGRGVVIADAPVEPKQEQEPKRGAKRARGGRGKGDDQPAQDKQQGQQEPKSPSPKDVAAMARQSEPGEAVEAAPPAEAPETPAAPEPTESTGATEAGESTPEDAPATPARTTTTTTTRKRGARRTPKAAVEATAEPAVEPAASPQQAAPEAPEAVEPAAEAPAAPEQPVTPAAPPAAPKVVTRTRGRSASRPAGPPAMEPAADPASDSASDSASDPASDSGSTSSLGTVGAPPADGAVEPGTADTELGSRPAVEHVPVKKRGSRKR